MSQPIDFDELVVQMARLSKGPERRIVALAGPPGAGKSHLSALLLERLQVVMPGGATILPMDGYHYDDLILRPRGDLARKGAPHTFDVGGLKSTIARVAVADVPVAVPVFDRSLEIARAGARIIGPDVPLVIVEGNYLLLKDPAWLALEPYFDMTVMIDVPEAVLRKRLLRRWAHLPKDEAEAKVAQNDLINMQQVLANSRPADFTLNNSAE